MGRVATPKKQSAARTLSARASPAPSSTAATAGSSAVSRESTASAPAGAAPSISQTGNAASVKPASAVPAHLKAGHKRSLEDAATDPPKKLSRRRKRGKKQQEQQETSSGTGDKSARSRDEMDEMEDGEVVQGDFSDLFFMDSTPTAVKPDVAFIDSAPETPAKTNGEETRMLGETFAAAARGADDDKSEDEHFRAFAMEMAASDEDEDLDEDEDEDEDDEDLVGARPFADDVVDEDSLAEAIRGKIVDDSAAKVSGRYYKEADLTKSCALCGEQGHSSRDCTHSQCFICGLVDSDHEARNCPVALVCTACGSRGHFQRDCAIAPFVRTSYGQRCSICSSNLHVTVNCSSLWRIYDTSDAKPTKRKIVFACGNDGSTKDHFIDDCLLPRGHPMRYADASAFNRAALGDAAIGLPGPSMSRGGATGAGSAARRRGGGGGGDRRQEIEDDAADDDWFASRSRRGGSSAGGSVAGSRAGSGRNTPNGRTPNTRGVDGFHKGGKPYVGGKFAQATQRKREEQEAERRRTHIFFGDDTYERFGGDSGSRGGGGSHRGSPAPGRGGGSAGASGKRDTHKDRDRRDERARDRELYGPPRGDYDKGSRRDSRQDSGRKGGDGGGSGPRGRRGHGGSEQGQRSEKPAPRYQGGYV